MNQDSPRTIPDSEDEAHSSNHLQVPTRPSRRALFSLPSYTSRSSSYRDTLHIPTSPLDTPHGETTPTAPATPGIGETVRLLDDGHDLESGRRGGSIYGAVHGAAPSTSAESTKAPGGPGGSSSTTWTRIKYYIPSLNWIPSYSFSLLGGDLLAGVTVAAMLIPQSVSYASSLAKLSPVTGLFSAAFPGLVYALLGTSRQLNVAPEASLSLLIGQAVSEVLHGDPHSHPEHVEAIGLAVSSVIVVQVGLISFILGFFRLGFIDVVLSRALLRGFVTGVAVVILVEQLMPMLGVSELEHAFNPQTTLDKILFLIEHGIPHAHEPTALISFVALGALVLLRNLKGLFKKYPILYRMPEVLMVVIVSAILSDQLRWDEGGIDILGNVSINTGSGFFHFPLKHSHLKYLRRTTSTAVLISIIGFLDSIVAAKQNGARFGHSISPNRELVALGAGNLMASFIPGCLPAYGSITRSRINGDVGGRTQMASIICSGIVLLATFFLLPWLYFLPKCVLGSIICLIVYSLLAEAPHDIIFYWRMRAWIDLSLMSLTFLLTIIWNVQIGVIVSLIISLLLVVRRSSRPRMTILGRIPGTDTWKPIDESPEPLENMPGTMIVRIRDNLDFANTAQLKERLRRLELYGTDPIHPSEEPRRQQATIIVFHLSDVQDCDASAVQIFYELFETYKERGVSIYVTHLRRKLRDAFERGGIVDLLGEDAFYQDVAAAISRVASEGQLFRGTY